MMPSPTTISCGVVKTHQQVVNLGFGENVRMISHDAVIVCQTNEQVKPAILIRRAQAPAAETARPKNFRPIPGGQ